jgi:AcrR family transcriptional regulator
MASRPETVAPRRPGRPARTEEERATQRARLLAATMDAVRRDGPDLSIDELAAAAAVSKPVLYDEFGGKVALADAMAVMLASTIESQVLGQISVGPAIDAEAGVRLVITAILDLIVAEPNIYAFLVRSMRANDRGFLDNALVREMHERAALLVQIVAPSLDRDALGVLTDGLFGFVFGAVESWQATRSPSKEKLVNGLTAIIVTGIDAASRYF